MKKKIFAVFVLGLMSAVAVHAQTAFSETPFSQGKLYASAGFSGLDLNYSSSQKWNLNVTGKVGYMFMDNWMVLADGAWNIRHELPNEFRLGAGARYYIEQNGLYLGAGANYVHTHSYDDLMPNVNVGYAFFLSRTVTLEPELYYDMSLKSFKDYSGFGFRIGFGIYLDDLF